MSLDKNKSKSNGGLLDPSTFTEGLWQGGRGKIVKAFAENYQAPNSQQKRAPVVTIHIKDATGEVHEERWGLGKDAEKRFKVIEGGKRIEAVGGTAKLNKNCKAAKLLASIEATAWVWDNPGSGAKSAAFSDLVGYTADWKREVMDVGDAIKQDRAKQGKGDITLLIVTDFVEGEEAEEEAEEGAAEEGSEEATDEGEEVDLTPLAKAAVEEILGDAPDNTLEVSKLQAAMLKHCESLDDADPLKVNTDTVVEAVGQTEGDDAWLVEQGFEIVSKQDAKKKWQKYVSLPKPAEKPKAKMGMKKK